MTRPALLIVLLAAPALLSACHPDPVHADSVAAQGPEDPGIPAGPLHRPGQPCLVCHSDQGPASMVMSLAGTLYKDDKTRDPLPNAIVRVTDSRGHEVSTGTNCTGNFFVQREDLDPVWPVWVQVEYSGQAAQMASPVFRDGSCADCHYDPGGPASAGHVYFAPSGLVTFPSSGCR